MFGLGKKELKIFKKLNTPQKIQDFLNKMSINFEEEGDYFLSPMSVLEKIYPKTINKTITKIPCVIQ